MVEKKSGFFAADGRRVAVTKLVEKNGTAPDVMTMVIRERYIGNRRTGAKGTVYDRTRIMGVQVLWVRHDDGLEAPYLEEELITAT